MTYRETTYSDERIEFIPASLGASSKFRKSTIKLRRVCPSVRMEQLGSHWTDFHYVWYLVIIRKFGKKESSFIPICLH